MAAGDSDRCTFTTAQTLGTKFGYEIRGGHGSHPSWSPPPSRWPGSQLRADVLFSDGELIFLFLPLFVTVYIVCTIDLRALLTRVLSPVTMYLDFQSLPEGALLRHPRPSTHALWHWSSALLSGTRCLISRWTWPAPIGNEPLLVRNGSSVGRCGPRWWSGLQ